MSFVDDMFLGSSMGEPARLDYAIREHERLQAQFDRLIEVLREKGILTRDDISRIVPFEETEP